MNRLKTFLILHLASFRYEGGGHQINIKKKKLPSGAKILNTPLCLYPIYDSTNLVTDRKANNTNGCEHGQSYKKNRSPADSRIRDWYWPTILFAVAYR